jgi:cholesterol transport system auxiliary component
MSARALLAALLLACASCGGILPPPSPPPMLYRLTPLLGTGPAAPPLAIQLVTEAPVAPAALDTARIALARSANSLDYFAGAAWTDRAPAMLQGLIVESLENYGRIRVVTRPAVDLRADAVLLSDLRDFEAEYRGEGPPELHVRLDCRLVRMPERTVIAVKSFEGRAHAAANDTPAIVAGFDEALHGALATMPDWVAANLAAPKPQ